MSLFDCFTFAYPRVSPIRAGFKVGCCIHGEYSPERLALLKSSGFDHVIVDWVEHEHAKKVYDNAKAAGLEVLAYSQAKTAISPFFRDTLLGINEPNSVRFWELGKPALVTEYQRLRIQNAKWPVPIIGGHLTWLAHLQPEQWVSDLWRYGLNDCIDYIGIHAYEGGGRDTVRRAEDIMALYRAVGFKQPFWITEFGWSLRKNPASPEKVARWATYALSKWSQNREIVGATIYELQDDPRYADRQYGLFDADGPRPTLGRIKEARG